MNLPLNDSIGPESEPIDNPCRPGAIDGPMDRWALFLGQTAPIGWVEIEPFFARGQVIHVGGGLDLVEVAVAVAEDDKSRVTDWMNAGDFGLLSTEIARRWAQDSTNLWGVVVTPWILVQDRSSINRPTF